MSWVDGVRNLWVIVWRNTFFCSVLGISRICKNFTLKVIRRHWNLRSRYRRREKLSLFLGFFCWATDRFSKLRIEILFLWILHKNRLLMQLRFAGLQSLSLSNMVILKPFLILFSILNIPYKLLMVVKKLHLIYQMVIICRVISHIWYWCIYLRVSYRLIKLSGLKVLSWKTIWIWNNLRSNIPFT
jgi:hypothetical protein